MNKYTGKNKRAKGNTFFHQNTERESEQITQGALNIAVNACFASMHASVGIRKHGEKAIVMIIKELKQLNDGVIPNKPVVIPINPDILYKNEKMQVLDAVTLIEEKRDNKLKTRCCTNGSKQKYYLLIASNTFHNDTNNFYQGITDKNTFVFKTGL